MPTLFGNEVSPEVFELNQHLLAQPKAPKTQARKAVALWRTEKEFQAAVFKAAAWEALRQPAFGLLFHIPNENSHRTPGVKGGVPDLFLAVPRLVDGRVCGGLWIELKIGSNKPSGKQLDVISELRTAGYQCNVVWDSVNEVIEIIHAYLANGKTVR